MNYNYYKIARNRAWQTLIETKTTKLPIDFKKILHYYDIKVFLLEDNVNEAFIKDKSIFLNKNLIRTLARFTMAHEIGHILLNHENLEHNINNNFSIEEYQANIFARCLLMPAIVLNEINCIDAHKIAKICDVSLQCAEYCSNRLKKLIIKDKFYTSYLEKQVYNNFKIFINTLKK